LGQKIEIGTSAIFVILMLLLLLSTPLMMFSLTIVAADGLNIETTTSDGSSIMTADVQGDDFAGDGGQKPTSDVVNEDAPVVDETGSEGQAVDVVYDPITAGSEEVNDEEDPVHIYYEGERIGSPPGPSFTVCLGNPLEITVLVKWDSRPNPNTVSYVNVQMVDKSDYGITFNPLGFTLRNVPFDDSRTVVVTIPAFSSTGTYQVNIKADVIAQGPSTTPKVPGTDGYFQVNVVSCEVSRQADLSIAKSGPEYAHVGDTITYTYTVINNGPYEACNVVVIDDKAGVATYVSGDEDDGCIDPGETWIFTATYTIQAEDPDPLVNTATVSSDTEDADLSNNVATWSVDVLHPTITIDKSADKDKAYAGDVIIYTITVTNAGDTPLYDVSVTDILLGTISIGTLNVDESATFTLTYTVNVGDPDPLVNTATASGKDVLGKEVTATDTASVDLIAKICGYKFYDANANGVWDAGEPVVVGFKIELYTGDTLLATAYTGDDGSYCFDDLDAGTYTVKEVLPSGSWINTTPLSITITLQSGEVSNDNNFGNLCLKPGEGGKTLGYWANAGNKLITDDDRGYLNGLNLYRQTGWAYPPFNSNEEIGKYLLGANAKNMLWMLSAQLIATILNVRHGYLDGSTLVCVNPPTCSSFKTINDIINGATSALDPNTPRAVQEYWKSLLDNLNNNRLPFVCPEPCAVEYP